MKWKKLKSIEELPRDTWMVLYVGNDNMILFKTNGDMSSLHQLLPNHEQMASAVWYELPNRWDSRYMEELSEQPDIEKLNDYYE